MWLLNTKMTDLLNLTAEVLINNWLQIVITEISGKMEVADRKLG